jgi:hypothetical protein
MRRKIFFSLFAILVSISFLLSCGSRGMVIQLAISYHFGGNFPGISGPPNSACWIEDAEGNFVRTLFISKGAVSALHPGKGKEKKVYLPDWYAASGGETDGTTGASLSQEMTHTHIWDCRDRNGNSVKPGQYIYKVETSTKGGINDTTCEGVIEIIYPKVRGEEVYRKSTGGPAYRKIFELDPINDKYVYKGKEVVKDCINNLTAEFKVYAE